MKYNDKSYYRHQFHKTGFLIGCIYIAIGLLVWLIDTIFGLGIF